jgi:5-formyltetrahydrofolate cyclo-ligase
MIELEKKRLREVFRKKRLALTPREIAEKSEQICQNFIKNLLPKIYQNKSNKIFSIYLASGGEVCTRKLVLLFEEKNLPFCYPRIVEKNQPLEFVLAEKNLDFAANKFYQKILEPINGKKISPDFLILPLLAFDQDLSRLGMGGGFFDRTILQLKVENPQLVTIGLGYDFQRHDKLLPIQKTDQKLDFIVTEKNLFLRS